MWPFIVRKPATQQIAQKALGVAGVTPPVGGIVFTTPTKPNPFSVEKHVNTIRGMLEALETQIATAEKDYTAEIQQHEKNQSAEIERHSLAMSRILTKQSELETLQASYKAALKIAAPGGDMMTGPTIQEMIDDGTLAALVVPAAAAEVSPAPKKPRRTRKAPVSAKPPHEPRPGHRETFVIPKGHEAIRDAEGRATGETRPIHINPSDRPEPRN